VFETLNARGVRLSATDLLKNHLFSVLDRGQQDDDEIADLEDRWEGMVGRLGAESFPDFLRMHWNSRRAFARQADLFKRIRVEVPGRQQVLKLVREMEEDLDPYLALSSPEVSEWPIELKSLASTLRTFNVRQPFPLLLAAWRAFDQSSFAGLMRACMVISMRFNVICSYGPAEQERVYNHVAEGIARGDITSLGAALTAMSTIYPSDAAFRAAFSDKTIRTTQSRNNRVVRYILCALEKQLSGQEYGPVSESLSVEHVLPQSPAEGWEAFTDEEVEAMVYRLGNMTLLQSRANRDVGNATYAEKRELLEKSGFAISRKLASENLVWSPEGIASHQAWMASQATAIWRIAQLS